MGAPDAPGIRQCETPKSPPGDYNSRSGTTWHQFGVRPRCETPKSPPGDYNRPLRPVLAPAPAGVKHLNPRQGITTVEQLLGLLLLLSFRVKHLNPRQGITTLQPLASTPWPAILRVKHLNPRQGITT